jgi:hypothetical protein
MPLAAVRSAAGVEAALVETIVRNSAASVDPTGAVERRCSVLGEGAHAAQPMQASATQHDRSGDVEEGSAGFMACQGFERPTG